MSNSNKSWDEVLTGIGTEPMNRHVLEGYTSLTPRGSFLPQSSHSSCPFLSVKIGREWVKVRSFLVVKQVALSVGSSRHVPSERGDLLRSRVESLGHGHWSRALVLVRSAGGVESPIGRRVGLGVFLVDGGEVRLFADRRRANIVLVIRDVGVRSLKTCAALLRGSVVVLCKVAD